MSYGTVAVTGIYQLIRKFRFHSGKTVQPIAKMIAWFIILPFLTVFLHVLIFSSSPNHCWIPSQVKKLVLSVTKYTQKRKLGFFTPTATC